MTWLISLLISGMLVSGENNLPIYTDAHFTETNTPKVVRLDVTERFEKIYPLSANGKISVSNVNGSITVEAWDRNEVKLQYVKTADTREHLADLNINIDAQPNSLRVEAEFGAWKNKTDGSWKNKNYNKLEVEFHLIVPRAAMLNEIETVNGSINVSNVTNFTKVSAVNGEVRATNLRGTADISTVNGTVEADFNTLENSSRISLSTVNGRANLVIPSDANATIKADTVNGNIINDFGLPVRKGQYVGRDLYGRVGSGAVQIKLSSVNGDLAVRRKADGKNVKPSANLLSQKSNEDIDNDVDNDIEKDKSSVLPNTIIRKEKIKQKEIDKAIIEAQKEISKIQPELEKIQIEALKQANASLNTEEMKSKIREAAERQKEAFENIREAGLFSGSPLIEKKSKSFAVKGIPKVKINAKRCAVVVRGWDKQEVQYAITRFSRNPNQTPLQPKVDYTDSEVNITVNDNPAENENLFNEMNRTRIEVFVPKKSNLKVITSGEIRLENVSGEIDLQGEDEAVNIRDVDGRLSVGTSDGRIRVIGFRGVFDGKTSDGNMNLEGVFQSFNAHTSDGSIILNLLENANAILEANTEIEIDGLNLIRENANAKQWRIGSGDRIYRMNVNEGKVIVRNASIMKAIQ